MKTELNKVVPCQSVMNWVGAALDDLRGDEDLPKRAWAHLQCESEADHQETLRLARADHAQGLLFKTHKGMVPDADGEVQDVHVEIDDAEDGVGSPPAEAAPAVPVVRAPEQLVYGRW